jgi:beta-N-acetylhexosaminidase
MIINFSIALMLSLYSSGLAQMPKDSEEVKLSREKWVQETLEQMNLDEKIGQLIGLRCSGHYTSVNSDVRRRWIDQIKELHIGGMILYGGSVLEAAQTTNSLQQISKIPLLFAADFESGVGDEIRGATNFPKNMAIGATFSEQFAYEIGKITALEARAIGIHQTYAPVADVNNNPYNPIINTRSFGEDRDTVAKFVKAYIRGCQDNWFMATAKHFPGHGDTRTDSHISMPVIPFSRARLDSVELKPFRAAIDAGVASIMTAHLAVPAIEEDTTIPATLSKKILTDLLRHQLYFNGLIVTDAMGMGAIVRNFGVGEAAVRAVKAGVDMVLVPPDPEAAISAIKDAVEKGEITEKRIDESVRRILEIKARLGLHENRFVDLDKIDEIVGTREHLDKAELMAQRSITLVKNSEQILPLTPDSLGKIMIVSIYGDTRIRKQRTFSEEVKKRNKNVIAFEVDPSTSEDTYEAILESCKNVDIVICGMLMPVRAWRGTIGLSSPEVQFVEKIKQMGNKVMVISFGNPYLIMDLPEVDAYLCAYDIIVVSQRAAVAAIFGEFNPTGHLPVSIPNLYRYGHALSYER